MMASTSKQTNDPLASGKVQENKSRTIEPDYNLEDYVRANKGKRKASVDGERTKKRHRWSCESNTNPNVCEPGKASTADVRAGPSKRKASPDRQQPRKRHRESYETTDTSKPGNVLVDRVSARGGKRKASADPETPKKRHRVGSKEKAATTNTSKPRKVLVEDGKARQGKRKASTGGERPRKRQKKLAQCSWSSSASEGVIEDRLPQVHTSRADFEAKYLQLNKIREGGCGSVYAGCRLADSLSVVIKHVRRPGVAVELSVYQIPLEVVLMQKVAGGSKSVEKCAAVSLLDWYYLDRVLILVMERPFASMDFLKYLRSQGGSLEEDKAKILMVQLVKAAIEMHSKGVFHRDIKPTNILVEVASRVPRVRIIDFGCGSLVQEKPYWDYNGTLALAPPEWFIRGEYNAVPTTVWQLGALLHSILHGSRFNTMSFICDKIPISSKLSQDCRDFLKLCLVVQPEERNNLQQLQLHPWLT